MSIPIAKEQSEFKAPEVNSINANTTPQIMPIKTGLPEAANDVAKSLFKAHNVLAQVKIDNDTVKANQLTMQLEQQLTDAMNSTEVDENGNIIGFLHKKGEDAFNSLPELDKSISGIYNNYLKEMSQLSPVAIEKLLLRGKDLVNSTQKDAFNYSFAQHEEYNKNNAIAMSNNIIVNAKATDGVVDEHVNTELEALMQQQRLINKGQSEEVIQDAIRTSVEKYFEESFLATDNKHSSAPTLGGGATYTIKEIKDAFNKGLISKKFFDKQLKQYEKEMCSTAVIRGGVTNYDKVFNLVLAREGLNTEEKEEYLAAFKKNIDKISSHAKSMLIDGSMHYRMIQANSLPNSYEVRRTMKEMFETPYSFYIDDKTGQLMHYDNKKQTRTGIDQWLKDNGLQNALKHESSIGFIKEMALYVESLKNNGATDSDWKKLNTMFNSVSKSPLTSQQLDQEETNQQVLGSLKYKDVHDSGQKNIKDKKRDTSKVNSDSFNLGTLTAFNPKASVESTNQVKVKTSQMLSDSFNSIISSSTESDTFDQSIDALEKIPERFQNDPDAFIFEEENKYITFLAKDQLVSYAKNAKKNRGYYINVPTDSQGNFETFLYKGNINYGNILRDVTYQVLNDDKIKNINGLSLENKFSNMDKNQKEYLRDIIENKVQDEIFKSMRNDTNNVISSAKDNSVLSNQSYAYKYIMSRASNDYTGTVQDTVVPFERTAQKVDEKPNFYKQFTLSENDLSSETTDKKNEVRGTWRRVVDTNNVYQISDDKLKTATNVLTNSIKYNGQSEFQYDRFINTMFGAMSALSDIKNNKMVFSEDADRDIKASLATLSGMYSSAFGTDLLEDFDAYQKNNGDIENYEKRKNSSKLESFRENPYLTSNQVFADSYFPHENTREDYFSTYNTLNKILNDVNTKQLYLNYPKFKQVKKNLR